MAIKPSNSIENFERSQQSISNTNSIRDNMKIRKPSISAYMPNGNTKGQKKTITSDLKTTLLKEAIQQSKSDNEIILDKCVEIYKNRYFQKKYDITQANKQITQYFSSHSDEFILRILLSFRQNLFKIMKSFKEQVQEIKELKMMFKNNEDESNFVGYMEMKSDSHNHFIERDKEKEKNIIVNGANNDNNNDVIDGGHNSMNDTVNDDNNNNNNNDNDEAILRIQQMELLQKQHKQTLLQEQIILKNKHFTELNNKLRIAIQKLTNLYYAFIESSSDIATLFKIPLKILSSVSKKTFDFNKIHKEEFCSVIFKDYELKTIISLIYDQGEQYAWLNEIINVVKSGYEEENKELARMEMYIQIELDKLQANQNQIQQQQSNANGNEKNNTEASNSKSGNGNDIPIDDLVKYINESPKSQPKSKKSKKKGSKQKTSSTIPLQSAITSLSNISTSSSLNTYTSIQPNKEKSDSELEILAIKSSIKENTRQAFTIHKIQAFYTKEWIAQLNK